MTISDKKEEEKPLSKDKSTTHKAEPTEKESTPTKEETIEVPAGLESGYYILRILSHDLNKTFKIMVE